MTGSYKRDARRRTAQRVEEKSRALDPAAGLDREFKDRIERDDERIPNGAIHAWFSLSYANYLVLPRSVLQSMPLEWQERFVALLRHLDERFGELDWPEYAVQARSRNGRFIKDPVPHYNRDAAKALKSDPRLVSPPVEGRSQDTTTDESGSRGGT